MDLHSANSGTTDFVVTIPFSFIAERWGVRAVLWSNLVPRVFMSAWALAVGACPLCEPGWCCLRCVDSGAGNYHHALPTKAIIAGPFLAVLGGDCVLQSTIFTLTSALSKEYVQRQVLSSPHRSSGTDEPEVLRISPTSALHPMWSLSWAQPLHLSP